jgi:cytochrome c oxidase subunit 2
MTRTPRPRHHSFIALAAVLPLLLAACSGQYPNTTFTNLTDFNRDANGLWNLMIWLGIGVFVFVEVLLVYVMFKYRRREGGPEPEHVHGNTKLELTWTVLPAVILAIITVPTVKSIWKFQTGAPANALQIDVIGHQWWWEFKYPEFNVSTANELYLPIGRPVNFTLRSFDVIHSFWIPNLGGKRDLMRNRTNTIWFTPDSATPMAYNGSCNEYCGASHANMRFRAYTVDQADFDSWIAGQRADAAGAVPAATPADTGAAAATPVAQAAAPAAPGYMFPAEQLPAHVIPKTPIPAGLTYDDNLLAGGDAARGQASFAVCSGCHMVRGTNFRGVIGPDLTHIASRHTIGGGLFPNDPPHLARWIKNASRMKPQHGSTFRMPTLGVGEIDPVTKTEISARLGGLTDQQIADVVAYLRTLR